MLNKFGGTVPLTRFYKRSKCMKVTVELLKGMFLKGYATEKGIILIPLSVIEIMFYSVYFILGKLNIQFITPYALEIIIMVITAFNIYYMMFGRDLMLTESIRKYAASTMLVLMFLTYPIFAEFPEIQSEVALLKIMIVIAWVTEAVKEYITFDVNKFFNKNMIVMFTMICIILKLGINYMLLIILLLLMIVNLLNTSKIK